ncbi:DUF4349 domain-containing protein [bacterium]|nr:MAG: DUF4349 domain-containing protein [bacterium]
MKTLYGVFFCVAITAFLSSCTASKHSRNSAAQSTGWAMPQSDPTGITENFNQYADGRLFENESPAPVVDTQKIVYTAEMDLTVKNPDSVAKNIIQLVKSNNGYVQRGSNTFLILKVPNNGMNAIITAIETQGKVTYKNITADDVTETYYDAATRLDNLNKTRLRYLDLLNKAQTIEEMLRVEKELERINGEIEFLKGRLLRMDNSIQYSTISVSLNKKVKPGILSYPFIWLYKGVSWLFVRN